MESLWNFGPTHAKPLSLVEFLAEKKAGGSGFFEGEEPFFWVCTEEMDDLSLHATKLVIEYCLGIIEDVGRKIRGRVSLARLEGALNTKYAE